MDSGLRDGEGEHRCGAAETRPNMPLQAEANDPQESRCPLDQPPRQPIKKEFMSKRIPGQNMRCHDR
jgi:hypothetical protein